MTATTSRLQIPQRRRVPWAGALARSAALVAGLTIVVRVFSVARELLVARMFGVSDALDAYAIAYTVPSFAMVVLAAPMAAAVVPAYVGVAQTRDDPASRKFSGALLTAFGAVFAGGALGIAASTPVIVPLISGDFSPEKVALTVRLSLVMSPVVFFAGIAAYFSALLNARGRFAAGALTPIVTPVGVAVTLLAAPQVGVGGLAWATSAGAALEATTLAAIVWRRSLLDWWTRTGVVRAVRAVWGQYVGAFVGSALMSSTLIVDQAMASRLRRGSVATLAYGGRISALVITVLAVAAGTVVTPYFSDTRLLADWSKFRGRLKRVIGATFVISVPITLALVALARPLVSFAYQRGAFDADAVTRVVEVHRMLALQIPFYVAGIVVVRAIAAVRASRLLVWGALLNVVVNVTANYYFMQMWGVAGIALSTSLVYVVSFAYASLALARHVRRRERATETDMSASAGRPA